MHTSKRVILAADGLSLPQCLEVVSAFKDRVYAIKIHDLIDNEGPDAVRKLLDAGAPRVGVDMKFADIPATIAKRAAAYQKAGASFVTVKGDAEIDGIMAAVKHGPETVWVVTALTSLSPEQVELMYGKSVRATVLERARFAKLAGANAVVCSPEETAMLAERPELRGITIVNPGVRSKGVSHDDQNRVGTPEQAIKDGAGLLVVGRQLMNAADKMAAIEELNVEIGEALKAREAAND